MSLQLIISVVFCSGNIVMVTKICTDCKYAFDEEILRFYTGTQSIHRNKLIFKNVALKRKLVQIQIL